MNKAILSIAFILLCLQSIYATSFSTAGFYELKGSGRQVYSMNPNWKFYKGKVAEAHQTTFDDSDWALISLPHGLEYLPEEASGGVNYQGEAWYRKHFTLHPKLKGKRVVLHFEGMMGKSSIWINGKMVKQHFDGYLPVSIDITDKINPEAENLLAVCTDNSDDPMFPPGKPQSALDFTYFGGIYRDCFLIAHNDVFITDPITENKRAGGGVLIHYPEVNEQKAVIKAKVHLRNVSTKTFYGKASFILKNKKGTVVAQESIPFSIRKQGDNDIDASLTIHHPEMWYPDSPSLHNLEIVLLKNDGTTIDGMIQRIGIRKIEYRGKEGLYMNGKPYTDKIIGVNRHQEFAVIGNAVPNSLHWRDAKKMRDAGVRIVRCTQYPHDPAFLDACDQLGILTLVTIAGWQFWSDEPIFAKRVYQHIRELVRRDRNHASLFFWEPVLNETHFPKEYAHQAKKCIDEEYPYEQALSACDPGSKGSEVFPVIFTHPQSVSGGKASIYNAGVIEENKMYFTREFGDNVDDWNSHNSNSRVHRSWGEIPMLKQAKHYASPDYPYTCLETLYAAGNHHVGGTLWHAFDHQRGYHPQPFYGGIMDAFRQPKTSYYMFMSQRPPVHNEQLSAETGPMVYVANEMTPFSPEDVTIYSNCEEVRLTIFKNGKQQVYKRSDNKQKMPSPIITFPNVLRFMDMKALSRGGKQADVYLLAEGLINGKVVVTHKRVPARRPERLRLRVDDDGLALKADGSDIVTIIAEIVDKDGVVKRLDNSSVIFKIEGEARLVGDQKTISNPVKSQWGSAPMLVQSTQQAGKVKIKAEIQGSGIHAIAPAELEIETTTSCIPTIGNSKYIVSSKPTNKQKEKKEHTDRTRELEETILNLKKKVSEYELREVEKQQDDFGEKR